MSLKNLMMWGVIVLLVVGLFELFKNPKKTMTSEKTPFSEFLKNIDDGRVIQVEIKVPILSEEDLELPLKDILKKITP